MGLPTGKRKGGKYRSREAQGRIRSLNSRHGLTWSMFVCGSVPRDPNPIPMPNSAKTPLIVRFVILACVLGAISVVACVEGPSDGSGSSGGGGGNNGQGPATVSFTMQAY